MNLPAEITHFVRWGAVPIAGPLRALILGDIHIPFQSNDAIRLAAQYGKDRKANTVLVNGDMLDFYAISRWEKNPKKRDLANEIGSGKQFLAALRDEFPKARIIVKEGNHEERWTSYLQRAAPELLGVKNFEWDEVYELKKHKMRLVGEKRPIRLGKLTVIHGHEYRFAIQNPVNPARGLFNRGKVHALCNHFHQSSSHSEKRLDGKVVSTWSAGCLCNMHPDYAVLNNWNHGFSFAEVTASGAFTVTNPKIIEGKIYE